MSEKHGIYEFSELQKNTKRQQNNLFYFTAFYIIKVLRMIYIRRRFL